MEKKKKLPKLSYDTDKVLATFKLKRKQGSEKLSLWLQNPIPIQDKWVEIIEQSRLDLINRGNSWNEEELKMHFISILFRYVNIYKEEVYSLFYERSLSEELNGYLLSVVCDSLVAKPFGIDAPDIPYFFLQEFKQQKGKYTDAEGQMLQAMLIAQAKNANGKPLYGCYIQGKNWTFAILDGMKYTVSEEYNATKIEDLEIILSALVRLKTIIEEELAD